MERLRCHLLAVASIVGLGVVMLLGLALPRLSRRGRACRLKARQPPACRGVRGRARCRRPPAAWRNQCEQLVRLLRQEGVERRTRAHQCTLSSGLGRRHPDPAGALPPCCPILFALWRAVGRAQVMHVLANSGWAWHLFAAPALWIGRLRGVPVIVNYRGGEADQFFSTAPRHVLASLRRAASCVTPSAFLERVFLRHGLAAEVIPNIVDVGRFSPQPLARLRRRAAG